MTLERIILVISLVLNLLLISLAVAIWPDRLLPSGAFFYRPPDSNLVKEEAFLASQASLLNRWSPSVFLNSQVESFRPIRDWSMPLLVIQAKAGLVYLLDNDKILFSQSPEKALPIASLTKIMTAAIVLEQMPRDQVITIEKELLNNAKQSQFIVKEQISVENLLYIMLITSNNDAANILAHNLARADSDEYFIELMNQKAKDLDLGQTVFVDASGLDSGNISSANDLKTLVEYTYKNYPLIWEILGLKSADIFSVDKKISHYLESTNRLWSKLETIIAGKTGYTEEANGCLLIITQAPNHSDEILSIILGSDDRFGQMLSLLHNVEKAYLW